MQLSDVMFRPFLVFTYTSNISHELAECRYRRINDHLLKSDPDLYISLGKNCDIVIMSVLRSVLSSRYTL